MDYPAWPTEFRRHAKLKQFVIKSHFNVSQHTKWKPCDSWLNLKEGSWKAALFAHSLSVLEWFLPGAVPGLPSLPQIQPHPLAPQCWAAGAARGAGKVQFTQQIPLSAAGGQMQRESAQLSRRSLCPGVRERGHWGMPSLSCQSTETGQMSISSLSTPVSLCYPFVKPGIHSTGQGWG